MGSRGNDEEWLAQKVALSFYSGQRIMFQRLLIP
jgi:hypothetical protein